MARPLVQHPQGRAARIVILVSGEIAVEDMAGLQFALRPFGEKPENAEADDRESDPVPAFRALASILAGDSQPTIRSHH